MPQQRSLNALRFVTVVGALLLSFAQVPWAQTAEEQALEYRREMMEQALATRQRYDHYGIRFDIDRAVIQPASTPLLDDIARTLENLTEWRLRIVGHTDATGSRERNQALSLERAAAIKAALTQRGVDANRLVVSGAGQERPVATNDTPQGRALNRRVELIRYTVSTEAQRLLRVMSDYVARQELLSFDYDATSEIVTEGGQKLGLASSGTMALRRPNQVRATRQGGFADVEMVFDSRTFTLFGRNVNAYTQVEVPGTIDQLVDELRERYRRPLPAADLLLSNPYDTLMSEVFDSKDLGSGVINGIECDWLAFRTEDVDWQVWIAQGERPHPVRYVITTKGMDQAPQYTIELRNWRTGTAVGPVDFTFQAPAGARSITLDQARESVGELPAHFTRGGRQP